MLGFFSHSLLIDPDILSRLSDNEEDDPAAEERRAEYSIFVQQLLYSSVCKNEEGKEKLPSLFPPAVHMKKLIDSRPKPVPKEKVICDFFKKEFIAKLTKLIPCFEYF